MGNKNYEPSWSVDREVVDYGGRFAPNGSSNPTAASQVGGDATVTRTAVAQYTVTIPRTFPKLFDYWASITMGGASVNTAQASRPVTNANGTTTMVINIASSATGAQLAADVSAGANNEICWGISFGNSAVTP